MVKEYIISRSRQLDHLTSSFHRMACLAICLLIILFGIIFIVIEQYINLPRPNYFATTSDGEIIQVTAMHK